MANSLELVDSLIALAMRALEPAVPRQSRVALVDFPNHNNSGDNAIWVGERLWLRRIGACVAYTCDVATYNRDDLRGRLGDGIVLIHGGGNFGDLWSRHQAFRERVVTDHTDLPIVQLPQTVHFSDASQAKRAGEILEAHPALTVFVRDRASLDVLGNSMGIAGYTCPDMAIFMGPLERPVPPTEDVVWLLRSDHESISEGTARALVEHGVMTDWLLDHERSQWSRLRRSGGVRLRESSSRFMASAFAPGVIGRTSRRLSSLTFDWLASRRVLRGVRMLSAGRIVVTDRLHGHILCLLMDIPHVLLPDRYGKIAAFRESFTSSAQTCWDAPNHDSASALVKSLSTKRDESRGDSSS